MPRKKILHSNINRIKRLKRLEKFVEHQLEEYIKIHKRNEKDLKYIG